MDPATRIDNKRHARVSVAIELDEAAESIDVVGGVACRGGVAEVVALDGCPCVGEWRTNQRLFY